MLLDNDKQTGGCSRRTEDMSHVRKNKHSLTKTLRSAMNTQTRL